MQTSTKIEIPKSFATNSSKIRQESRKKCSSFLVIGQHRSTASRPDLLACIISIVGIFRNSTLLYLEHQMCSLSLSFFPFVLLNCCSMWAVVAAQLEERLLPALEIRDQIQSLAFLFAINCTKKIY